ncbi:MULTISPECIES: DUF7344 domain-containing protein [Haloprofundus]|uniref:DUF7344 domain-containing protein n=1 Tax=Haloprofundus TaxID=1911573 RepID=UPI000E44E5D4|nr:MULTISPECIES: hypothetical protein [Haloprofundus]QCJ48237.1 hypothetical protein FCF25_14380 [Haloprofundus sp. MHR1]
MGVTEVDENELTLSREEAFETLSNRRRRYAIHALLQEDAPVELGELSRQVAAWETGQSPSAVSSEERRRVYNALQQSHLPKMHDVGVVEYDRDRGIISTTTEASNLHVYLEIVPGNDIPWSVYYLLLGAFSLSFAGAVVGGLPPFGAIPSLVGALVPGLLLVASAAVHTLHSRRQRLGRDGLPPELRHQDNE